MSFGVFVTTAFIAPQAYQEVREDEHPVVFLAGREIATLLKRMGLTEPRALSDYLTLKFPVHEVAVPKVDVSVSEMNVVIEVGDQGTHGSGAGAQESTGSAVVS